MVIDLIQQAANLLIIMFILRWAQIKLEGTAFSAPIAYLFH